MLRERYQRAKLRDLQEVSSRSAVSRNVNLVITPVFCAATDRARH